MEKYYITSIHALASQPLLHLLDLLDSLVQLVDSLFDLLFGIVKHLLMISVAGWIGRLELRSQLGLVSFVLLFGCLQLLLRSLDHLLLLCDESLDFLVVHGAVDHALHALQPDGLIQTAHGHAPLEDVWLCHGRLSLLEDHRFDLGYLHLQVAQLLIADRNEVGILSCWRCWFANINISWWVVE